MPPPEGERTPLPGRLLGAGARGARAVAGAAGLDQVAERTTEEAIVRALESPAVERAIFRVLESDEAQQALGRALASPAVERAAVQVIDSDLVDRVWERLLASDEIQKTIERIAEAPELRAAIASQGVGLINDLGRQISRATARLDDLLERFVRRLIGRPRTEPTRAVGLITRALSALVDAAIINAGFLIAAGVIAALFGNDGVSAAEFAFGAGAWIIVIYLYAMTFWSLAGQTPGMRFLSIRLEHDGSPRLGRRRARRRLFGAVLALIPFGLGFLGVLTRDDRRGFHDRRADTDMVRVDPVAPWSQLSARE
ncbi:MAG: RDD family protein [Solirubrobacterales bacterium]